MDKRGTAGAVDEYFLAEGEKMFEILIKAASFLLIIVLGYTLKKIGFFKKEDYRLVTKIVLNVTLPAAIIVNFSATQMPLSLLFVVVLGFGANIVMILSARIGSRKASLTMQKFRMINYSAYSIGCFSLPFIQNFLGPTGVVTTSLFDAGNTLMCCGGTYSLCTELDRGASGNNKKTGIFVQIKNVLATAMKSVPLVTSIIMLMLSVLHIKTPAPVLTLAGMIANANAFLATFMIGMMFELHLVAEERKEMVRLLAFRYGFSALIAAAFYFLLPFSEEIRQTLTLLAFSPMSASSLIFTDRLNCDTELSSACNSLSIVISLAVMTVLVMIFQL